MEGVDYNYLSESATLGLSLIIVASACLSFYGSASAVYVIVKHGQVQQLYHRLILCLSLSDMIFSVGCVVQVFGMRSDLGFPLAFGNVTTCSLAGSLFNFYLVSAMYNALLSLFFWGKLSWHLSDGTMSQRCEPAVHIFCVGLPVSYSIVSWIRGGFNPDYAFRVCLVEDFPAGCSRNTDVECERGYADYNVLSYIYFVAALLGLGATWAVYISVRKQLRQMQQTLSSMSSNEAPEQPQVVEEAPVHRGTHTIRAEEAEETEHSTRSASSGKGARRKRQQLARQRSMRILLEQAVLYTMAFLNGFVIVLVATFMDYSPEKDLANSTGYLVVTSLFYFLFPIQGLFNWLIYIRMRWSDIRKQNQEESWWWAYRQLYTYRDVDDLMKTRMSQGLATKQGESSKTPKKQHQVPASPVRSNVKSWADLDLGLSTVVDDIASNEVGANTRKDGGRRCRAPDKSTRQVSFQPDSWAELGMTTVVTGDEEEESSCVSSMEKRQSSFPMPFVKEECSESPEDSTQRINFDGDESSSRPAYTGDVDLEDLSERLEDRLPHRSSVLKSLY